MIESSGVLAAGDPTAVSRIRALDLLDEQYRRISELIRALDDGQLRLRRCTAGLAWRAPSRMEFDIRLTELNEMLTRAAGSLSAALTECDRARDLLRACRPSGEAWHADLVAHPAGGSSSAR